MLEFKTNRDDITAELLDEVKLFFRMRTSAMPLSLTSAFFLGKMTEKS